MDFQDLERLRRIVTELRQRQVVSLQPYYDGKIRGFQRLLDGKKPRTQPPKDATGLPESLFSLSSSATCIASLIANDRWVGPWATDTRPMIRSYLAPQWKGAGLPQDNIYTTAFVLEAVELLGRQLVRLKQKKFDPNPAQRARISKGLLRLLEALRSRGFANLEGYPPSAYMTQLVVRVLLKWLQSNKIVRSAWSEVAPIVVSRAWDEINRQLALFTAKSKSSDPYELAYSILLVVALSEPGKATPDQSNILQASLELLFESQLEDGSWPRSSPLFHHQYLGSAFCYEYEMLVQLLAEPKLRGRLIRFLPNFERAISAIINSSYEIPPEGRAWSSGHHRQATGPESWSTASVYHFLHLVDRLVAEAIRRALFEYLDKPYTPPLGSADESQQFAIRLLDCDLVLKTGAKLSLRETLTEHFLDPIRRDAELVALGGALPAATPMSGILFGPPGTSKTQLAQHIAQYLGWPLLGIDPSHFTRNGLDRIQAEADKVFWMLSSAERVVVLLDEFDEMVRERGKSDSILSRFLTTAMLPKLATINEQRRIVFLVATNHIENFDLAISRPGRFDMILQVMPPSYNEKVKQWRLDELFARLNVHLNPDQEKEIADLTYDEIQKLAARLSGLNDHDDKGAWEIIKDVNETCTLRQNTYGAEDHEHTWKEACEKQRAFIRLPSPRKPSHQPALDLGLDP